MAINCGTHHVDATERDTVGLVRAGHEQGGGGLHLLEEHNALATEAAGEEDQHGARGDGRAQGLLGLATGRLGNVDRVVGVVLGRVPLRGIAGRLVGAGTLEGAVAVVLVISLDSLALRRERAGQKLPHHSRSERAAVVHSTGSTRTQQHCSVAGPAAEAKQQAGQSPPL